MPAGRPLKYSTPEEMQEVIDLYFSACRANRKQMAGIELTEEEEKLTDITEDVHPTISGMSLVLDLDRKSLINYQGREEFFHTVKKGKARVEAYVEQRLHNQACTGMIFSLKNNFDWEDKTSRELSGPNGGPIPVSDMSEAEIDRRLAELDGKLGSDKS